MNNYNNETNQQQTNNVNPAQVQNYITWINSHLKKRPGVKLVENLHSDITNGVPLIHLIEVISGDVLADVNLNPKNHHDYKENIDKVLKFMQLNSVKIARTTSKEILDGNLKSIMRVILALAAHFKPSNLQSAPNHSSTRSNPSIMGSGISSTTSLSSNKLLNNNNQLNSKSNLNSTRTLSNIDSMTHLVQAACVSFADVRRYKNENFNVKYVRRNNLLQNGQSNQETLAQSNRIDLPPPVPAKISNNKMFSNSCVNINNNNNNKMPVVNNNEDTYPTFCQRAIASSTMISQTKNIIDDQTFVIEKKENNNYNNNNNMTTQTDLDLNKVESVTQLDVPEILDDVQNLKNALLNLQKLFMNGDRKCFEEVGVVGEQEEEENNKLTNNGDLNSSENEFVLENLSKDEQIAILRSKIQQLEIVSNDLRNELNETKSESMNNYGMQSGLRARLTELDQNLIDMKNEHINLQLHNQQLVKEKEKYITLLDLNTIEMNKLKADLCLRDETIDKLKMEMNSLLKTDLLRKQIKNIADIEEIKEKESVISGLIANRKLCIIDSKLAGSTSNNNNNNKKSDTTFTVKKNNNNSIADEEKNSIRDTLNQLRHNFKPSHPSLFLIDTLEQNILAICERSHHHHHHQEIEPDIDLVNYKSSKVKYSVQPPPSSIGLITSSTSSINSSTSSSSSSNSSSSANSPILSNNVYTITTQQHHHQQLQTPFQRYLAPSTTITSNNNNNNNASLKRIEIKTVNKNEIELPIVNNSEQTNVKKIISRLLSQTNNSSAGLASTASSSTTTTTATTTKKKNDADMMYPSSSSSSSGIQTISKSSHLGANNNMLLTISPNSSTTPNTISSPSSTHSPTSSSSSSSSISNLNSLTKCIYYKNNEPNPYSTTVFKSINKVTLYDFKERISKQLDINRHFKFFFKSQDPEFGYLKEEVTNDKTILPTFDNQIVAYIVEIE